MESRGSPSVRPVPNATPIRAAEYVRMSTAHQQYSTENQNGIIHQDAERRVMIIVRTYADAGKSVLRIDAATH